MQLLLADLDRFFSRRITKRFPMAVGLLVLIGCVIAWLVVSNNDASINFVEDLANEVGDDGEGSSILAFIIPIVPLMGLVIGASFYGADQKTGMIEQLLTWEPRRLRVISIRALAGAIGTFVVTALLGAFTIAILYLLATVAGTTDGIDGDLWGSMLGVLLRTAIVGGLFAIIGVAVCALVGSSVGTIVGFVIYWALLEGALSFLIDTFLPWLAVWLPFRNGNAFANGTPVQRIDGDVFDGDFDLIDHHDWLAAGGVVLAFGVGIALLAGFLFDRRDVA